VLPAAATQVPAGRPVAAPARRPAGGDHDGGRDVDNAGALSTLGARPATGEAGRAWATGTVAAVIGVGAQMAADEAGPKTVAPAARPRTALPMTELPVMAGHGRSWLLLACPGEGPCREPEPIVSPGAL
jgi:hypothetical protein